MKPPEIKKSPYDGKWIFTGPEWDDWEGDGGGIPFCIHGIKRRWGCDECDEEQEERNG